jgi:hypothetical protein
MSAASKKVPAVPISDPLSFNPFDDPKGWTPIPSVFFDLFKTDPETGQSRLMCLAQAQLLLVLAREKWFGLKRGGPPPSDPFSDPHSLLWIGRQIGTAKSQTLDIVADLLDRGLVEKVRRNGERESRFRLATEKWSTAPFYKPKGIAAAEDTSEEAGEEPAKQHTGGPVSSDRIPAGRTTVLEIAQTGQKLRAKNKFDIDIDVGVVHVADGLLEVEFGPAIERPAQIVEISPGDAKPGKRRQTTPHPAATGTAAGLFPELREFLLPRFSAANTTLTDKTLARIGKAAQGEFVAYKLLIESREQRGPVKPNAYVAIAEQDLKAYAAQRAEVEAKGLKAPVRKKSLLQRLNDGDPL